MDCVRMYVIGLGCCLWMGTSTAKVDGRGGEKERWWQEERGTVGKDWAGNFTKASWQKEKPFGVGRAC